MSSAKQLKDSISQFEKGNRQDLADKEKVELDIISSYLPEQLSDNEIIAIIKKIIQDVNPNGASDMGKVMGFVMPQVKGRADGKIVNTIVTEKLRAL